MRQQQRRYTAEFREDAVRLVKTTDRSVTSIAEGLGVSHWTLRDWYRADVAKKKTRKSSVVVPDKESDEEKAARLERENRELRKRVEELETDRDILKKAAAFFAKESE